MRVTLFCKPDNSGFEFTFYNWREERGRMANIDIALMKVLGYAKCNYSDTLTISKDFHVGTKLWQVQSNMKEAVKVLNGFMLEPEVISE